MSRFQAARCPLWAQAHGSLGERDDDGNGDAYDYDFFGLTLGADMALSPHLRAGVAAGYSATSVDSDNPSGGELDADSFEAGAYARLSQGRLRIDGAAAFGLTAYDSSRNLAGAGSASADFNGYEVGAMVEGGYSFDLGGAVAEPFAGIEWLHVSTEGFRESGAGGLGLAVSSEDTDSVRARLGITLQQTLEHGGGRVTPFASLAYARELGDDTGSLNRGLIGSTGARTTVNSAEGGRNIAELGLGLGWQLEDNLTLSIGYDGAFSSTDSEHGGHARLTYRW